MFVFTWDSYDASSGFGLTRHIHVHPHFKDTFISVIGNRRINLKKIVLFSEQEGKTDDIQELRNKIMKVMTQEPYMGKKTPVR